MKGVPLSITLGIIGTMSTHYSFTFNCFLDPRLGSDQETTLDYIFGANKSLPERLPAHWFYDEVSESVLADFQRLSSSQVGRGIMRLWQGFDSTVQTVARGVNLHVTDLKLEGVWGYCGFLGLLSWLASLSMDCGLVGAISPYDSGESVEDQSNTLLVIRNRELCVSNGCLGECSPIIPPELNRF